VLIEENPGQVEGKISKMGREKVKSERKRKKRKGNEKTEVKKFQKSGNMLHEGFILEYHFSEGAGGIGILD
jgi:hypothetical protein